MINALGRYVKKAHASPIWLTVFCDMTTNLMLFFLLLYGFTRLSQEKQMKMYKSFQDSGTKDAIIKQKATRVLKDFHEEEATSALSRLADETGPDISLSVNMEQIRITLNSPILFNSGEAKLKYRRGIGQLAAVLKKIDAPVIIEGHTDDIPISKGPYSSNWGLSVARSVSVIETLVNDYGFQASKLIAAGYGEYHPLVPNDSSHNRAKNRRIEIVILRRQ